MNNLRVMFDDAHLSRGTIALPVQVFAEDGQLVATGVIHEDGQLALPISQAEALSVRIRLPSGQTLTRFVPRDNTEPVVFKIGPSRQEWLAQEHLYGEAQVEGNLSDPLLALSWWRLWFVPKQSQLVTPLDPGVGAIQGPSRVCDAVQYRFQAESLPSDGTAYFQIGGPQVAWRVFTLPRAESFDVTVHATEHGYRHVGLRASVNASTTVAETLARLLATGSVEAGVQVMASIPTAEDLLYAKRRDPLGAAVGGYWLLKLGAVDRLHGWPQNLAEWFPALPDGAVIRAWELLRSQGEVARPEARSWLIEAARRGIPFYTEGLRLLRDGLALVADHDHDAELDVARRQVSLWAWAADWTRSTTSFSGKDPLNPSREPVIGLPEDVFSSQPIEGTWVPSSVAECLEVSQVVSEIPANVMLFAGAALRASDSALSADMIVRAASGLPADAALSALKRALDYAPEPGLVANALFDLARENGLVDDVLHTVVQSGISDPEVLRASVKAAVGSGQLPIAAEQWYRLVETESHSSEIWELGLDLCRELLPQESGLAFNVLGSLLWSSDSPELRRLVTEFVVGESPLSEQHRAALRRRLERAGPLEALALMRAVILDGETISTELNAAFVVTSKKTRESE